MAPCRYGRAAVPLSAFRRRAPNSCDRPCEDPPNRGAAGPPPWASPHSSSPGEGLFGRTLLKRGLTKLPAELLPRQRVRLTETWDGAPQLDRAEVELTATAKGTRESAAVTFLAVPWLVAGVLAVLVAAGWTLWARARRRRTRTD